MIVKSVRIAVLWCVVFGVVLVGSAGAATGYERVGAFNEAVPDGLAAHHHRVAVNRATGDVYLTDPVGDEIAVYRSNGSGADLLTSFGSGALSDPRGIAIDQATGDVYVADADDVVKYVSDGAATPTFTMDGTFTSPSVTGSLAFDATADQLLVADAAAGVVRRFSTSGAAGGILDGSAGVGSPGAFAGLQDLAVDSTGDIVVVDSTGNPAIGDGVSRVERFASDGAWEATIGPVEQAATVAIRPEGDEVIVSGDQNKVFSSGNPTLHVFSREGESLGEIATDPVLQYATVAGMASDDGPGGRLFVATDNADYGGDYSFGYVSVQMYEVPQPAAPVATTGAAAATGSVTARLSGVVTPNRASTSYYFEYGVGGEYGSAVPAAKDGEAGSAGDPVAVTRFISGLAPDTTYHYRLVAVNGLGTSVAGDRTFRTPAVATGAPADSCGNADVRAQQQSSYLPDCRAFEMVSPVDKNGGDVLGFDTDVRSSEAGDRATYASFSGFAGAPNIRYTAQYLGGRGPGGWSSAALLPQQNFGSSFPNGPTQVVGLSDDLGQTVVNGRDPAPAAGAQPGTYNLFVRDTLSGRFGLLTSAGVGRASNAAFAAASRDFSHILFESKAKLTADAPIANPDGADPTDHPNLYESVNGQVRLVGIRPDGSVAPQGASAGFAYTANGSTVPRGALGGLYTYDAMSRDGSVIFWTDLETNQLYARIDGTRTVAVSASKLPVLDPAQPALFQRAAPDGSTVLFLSEAKLTAGSTAGTSSSGARDLYRYNTKTGGLTDLMTVAGKAANGVGVLGVSDDGAQVYFAAFGDGLAVGAPAGQANIYLWRDGHLQFVAGLPNVNSSGSGPDAVNWATGAVNGNQIARVSSDGRVLLFSSSEPVTGQPTDGHRQLYRYDADSDQSICVSCDPQRGASTADASLTTAAPNAQGSIQGASPFLPRNLSADGQRVFFQTAEALVSADTNGRRDVYVWEAGHVGLISSGQSDNDTIFGDADVNGDNVFFTTRQSLVPGDRDSNADLYVARVNGGFLTPKPRVPCAEDQCQGAFAPPSPGPLIGSISFNEPSDEASVGRAPASRIKVGAISKVRGVTATLKVQVPSAGSIRASGASVRTSTSRATKASTVRVTISLTSKAKVSLRKHHTLKVKLRIAFTPKAGSPASKTLTVTFLQPSKRQGKTSASVRSMSKGAR